MKPPAFWDRNDRWLPLLAPLSYLYTQAGRLRFRYTKSIRADVPVICIGNLTVGGAGKTPTAIAIGQLLKKRGVHAFFISRGYGGERTEPLLVNPHVHSASEVGDEPLLLARHLPTIVAADRVAGAKLAVANGARAIILDDGFQNPRLAKDLSLLVIDGGYGLGNGKILPAGPLREAPEDALPRADAIVLINSKGPPPLALPEDLTLLRATTVPSGDIASLKGKEVVAFCGIARPEKFFSMLEEAGIRLSETVTFGDHHPYSHTELEGLLARDLPLITTAKDAVRLTKGMRARLSVLDISVEFEDKAALDTLLSPLHFPS